MAPNAFLNKAEQFIRSARMLSDNGDYDSAISRAYYAMFYVAEALLGQLGLSYSSHKAVISAYGLHFAKTRQLDPRFHEALINAFDKRQLGDYTTSSGLTKTDADRLLTTATEFVDAARQWLESNPSVPSQ
jgi:uncharacterized protein (UPF0332 family)